MLKDFEHADECAKWKSHKRKSFISPVNAKMAYLKGCMS